MRRLVFYGCTRWYGLSEMDCFHILSHWGDVLLGRVERQHPQGSRLWCSMGVLRAQERVPWGRVAIKTSDLGGGGGIGLAMQGTRGPGGYVWEMGLCETWGTGD